jgi:hypothetical protein
MEKKAKERIRTLLKERNISFNSISETSAIQAQFSRAFGKGKDAKLSYELIEIVLRNCPDVSADWLLMGEGDMYKKTTVLPPVDVSSEESIEHSAEIARLVREKNELIDANEELREENKMLRAQLEVLKDVLRSSLGSDAAQKVG